VGVKFLSEEWMTAMGDAANGDEAFRTSVESTELKLQFHVTEAPEGGDVHYTLTVEGGQAALALGEDEGAHATITNDYETATAISKGELNTQMAFMTGKLKVGGDMAKVMMNQGQINAFAKAVADVEVDY
jgi:putative sterol carrier protein